jgi:hypothetical protein
VLGYFPLRWTDRGIVYHPTGAHQQRDLGGDPLLTTDLSAIVLRWADVWSLWLVEPWPRAVLRWSGGEVRLAPVGGPLAVSPEEFAARLEALAEHLAQHAPSKVRSRGWLDVPEQPWEQVRALPELPSDATVGEGAFRSAPRPVEEPVVALRPPPAPFEAMLGWLASGPTRPWRDHPRQIRLTETFLYAERRDKTVWRVPLDTLRARLGESARDGAYVFGRRTTVIVTHRPECPVRAALDARLR